MSSWRRSLLRSLLHRIDAWGVALIVGTVALMVHDRVDAGSLALVVTIGLAYWLGYTVNDYFDAPYDAADRSGAHRNFFVAHPVPRGWALAAFLVALAVVLLGFSRFVIRGWVAFAVAVAAMWGYSAPPVRLKSRPGLDLLSHALFVQTFPYLLTVYLISGRWSVLDTVLVTANLLASLSGQLAQQIRDFEIDSVTDRNFTTTVGLPVTRRALRGVTGLLGVVVAGAFALRLLPWSLAPVAAAFVPALFTRLQGSGERRAIIVYCSTGFALLYAAGLVLTHLVPR